jgi:lipopolysaccharide biosynthesis protein
MSVRSKVKSAVRKAKVLKNLSYRRLRLNAQHVSHYANVQRDLKKHVKTSDIAVVIHLYYPESWGVLSRKLKKITEFNYDVFVSLPENERGFTQEIIKDFPNAFVYISPNRGRDVLPFMSIIELLYNLGYKQILKLHSKKSTHRTDGSDWFSDLINALIPESPTLQKDLLKALERPNTGLIGPAGNYTSLTVNFDANGVYMTDVVKKLYGKECAYDTLQLRRSEYGFFAGTMLWINVESIKPLFVFNKVKYFNEEKGQIDATFAHALERLLGVIPEINSWDIYEVGSNKVQKIEYSSGDIPDWSKVYIGPKG